MNKTRNSRSSWFRKLRMAAGYQSVASLARELSIGISTAHRWERTTQRPLARDIIRIAGVFHASVEVVVERLWRERIGDLCKCGCGGRKIFPVDSPMATHLHVERACAGAGCGEKRIYKRPARHHRLCQGCAYTARRKPRVLVVCDGYKDHGSVRHASHCVGKQWLLPLRLRYYQQNPASTYNRMKWERPGTDEAHWSFMCKRCYQASFIIAVKENWLKKNLTHERIRSRKQRNELWRGGDPDDSHDERIAAFKELHPKFYENRFVPPPRQRTDSSGGIKGALIAHWSKSTLPQRIKFTLCLVCKKLHINPQSEPQRANKFHKQCFYEFLRTPWGRQCQGLWNRGLRPDLSIPRPGAPLTEENLKLHFSWAVCHYFRGDSIHSIAKSRSVSPKAIRKDIQSLIKIFDPAMLKGRYKRWALLLLDAARTSNFTR